MSTTTQIKTDKKIISNVSNSNPIKTTLRPASTKDKKETLAKTLLSRKQFLKLNFFALLPSNLYLIFRELTLINNKEKIFTPPSLTFYYILIAISLPFILTLSYHRLKALNHNPLYLTLILLPILGWITLLSLLLQPVRELNHNGEIKIKHPLMQKNLKASISLSLILVIITTATLYLRTGNRIFDPNRLQPRACSTQNVNVSIGAPC